MSSILARSGLPGVPRSSYQGGNLAVAMRALVSRIGAAGVLSLALAIVVAITMVVLLFPLTSDMPAWDQWTIVPIFEAHYSGRPVLPLLLAPYNGHYNCLPRFLLYRMGVLSRWDTRLEALMGFGWAACTLGLLLRMLWESSPRLLILAAPFAAWVFSALQFQNFLNGFGMGQLLAEFAAILALYLLTDPEAGRWRFGLALLCAAAAFLSHGAGLAVAPAGLVGLLLVGRRPNWVRIGAWSLVTAFGAVLGLLGGRSMQLVMHWRRVPAFALALVGRPFTFDLAPSPARTAALGAFVIVVLGAVIAWAIWRDRAAKRDLLARWGCVALLALGVAGLVAMSHSAAPLDLSLSSHYVTSTYPVGLALLVLIVDRLQASASAVTGGRRWLPGLAVLACCVAPLAQQAMAAYRIVPMLRSWKTVGDRMSRRVVLGTATDQEIGQAVHTNPDDVRSAVPFLRSHRLAWFAHAPEARLPFGELDSVAGLQPASTVTLRQGTPWVFEGWAVPPLLALDTPIEAALVVDGVSVVGARPGGLRPDQEAYYRSRSFLTSGFALVAPDGERRPPGRYRVSVVLRSPQPTVTLRRLELVVLPR